MDPKTPPPKCECGALVGLWFCERLGRYVCPPCLDKEITDSLRSEECEPCGEEPEANAP